MKHTMSQGKNAAPEGAKTEAFQGLSALNDADSQMLVDLQAGLARNREAYLLFDTDRRLKLASLHYNGVAGMAVGASAEAVFESLMRENNLTANDPIYSDMKQFWNHMDGQAVFVQDKGLVLRMRAEGLPGGRGTMLFISDMTKARRQEQALADKTWELEQALIKEREANQLQRQFIAMVSHEFRTPLSIIDGNAQLIDRHVLKGDTEQISKRSRTIRSAVSRLIQMMEGVLSSNLLRTGQIQIKRQDCDLAGLIENLCAEQRELSPHNSIHVDVSELPPVLPLDPKLMTQIITNLLSNAVKYGRDNPMVHVRSWIHDDFAVLQVGDNGVGIPDEEKYKIFDRFYRASTSSGVTGTGIGLSLVREMVDLHGGRIEVNSVVGNGTTFTIYLRLSDNVGGQSGEIGSKSGIEH